MGPRDRLTAEEQKQQYRRMVFNMLAANVDDHTKNFSFVMDNTGTWHLAPAYDLTFSCDPDTHFYRDHELTILGKRNNITKKDLLLMAQRQDIKEAAQIIDEVANAVAHFKNFATETGISNHWIIKMEKVLSENSIG